MNSLTILHPSARLDMRPYLEDLRALADSGGFLLWNRQGMVGKVPNAKLRDAMELYDAYETLRSRGRITELPETAYEIGWFRVEDIRPESGLSLTPADDQPE